MILVEKCRRDKMRIHFIIQNGNGEFSHFAEIVQMQK